MSPRTRPALFCALLLAGCTVGPDYHAPSPQIADHWADGQQASTADEAGWWHSLRDPLLDALVDEMLAANPNLKEASARLEEARASRDAVRGGRLPQVQASGTAADTVLSKNGQIPIGSIPGFSRQFGLFDVGFDASWELDVWGKRTRQLEAAGARVDQADMAAQGVRLQLVAELARAYVDLRQAQSDAALAGETLETQTRLATLTQLRVTAGEAGQSDAERAGSDAANARATLANAQANVRAAALRVTALVGAHPEAMLPRLEAPAPIPAAPAAIAAGLPAELLRRRPDIRTAERDLAASTADVGVATADLFPRLSLSLGLGQQARSIAGLFDSDSSRLQAGGGLAWPIFNGGATRARIRVAGARVDQAAARYDAAVIAALADSETAINRFDRALVASAASTDAAGRDSAAFDLASQRVRVGEDDQLALARARLTLIAARQRASAAQAAATSAAIGLHKALGGGWNG